MRNSSIILAAAAGILCAMPSSGHAQNPSQMLQGLLSGNQGQDQAIRDAFERGYRNGREDQARDDRARFERDRPPPPPRGQYPDQDPNYYQRNPYNR